MGFVKDVAKTMINPITLGLFSKNKKKPSELPKQPTMISTTPYERPISMIRRGG